MAESRAAFDCLSLALTRPDMPGIYGALSSSRQAGTIKTTRDRRLSSWRGWIRDAFDILNHRKLIALVDKSAVRFTCSKFLCLALNYHYHVTTHPHHYSTTNVNLSMAVYGGWGQANQSSMIRTRG